MMLQENILCQRGVADKIQFVRPHLLKVTFFLPSNLGIETMNVLKCIQVTLNIIRLD